MSIVGIGLDLLEISRMVDKIENAAFMEKYIREQNRLILPVVVHFPPHLLPESSVQRRPSSRR